MPNLKDEEAPRHCWSKKTVRIITAELKKIRKERGALKPEYVVEAARNPKSPLNPFFDWDDESAAEKHRLRQASQLMRAAYVVVTLDGVDRPMRTFLSVTHNDVKQYVPVAEIQRNPQLSTQIVEAARLDLEGWLRRYEMYKALFKPSKTIRKALEEIPPEDDDEE